MAAKALSRNCSQLASSRTSSAASVFLQLSQQRSIHTPPPFFEFLAPSLATLVPRENRLQFCKTAKPQSRQVRSFTSSPCRLQTSAIFNPRQDEDGNAMHIDITPRASNRLKEIMSKDANPSLALRIQVESGGCHGFQYLMSLTTLPPLETIQEEAAPALITSSNDPNAMPSKNLSSPSLSDSNSTSNGGIIDDADTVFLAGDGTGAKVVMDGPSLELLKGSKVDYTMELIGSQFKIVDNPLATSSCGCGTSFDIK